MCSAMSWATSRAFAFAGVDPAELHEHADHAALVLHVLVARRSGRRSVSNRTTRPSSIFSPSLPDRPFTKSSTRLAVDRAGCRDPPRRARRRSSRARRRPVLNTSPLATKSVSQLSSTSAPTSPSTSTSIAALVGLAARALGRARDALLTQPVLGALHVAFALLERLLAIHHPGAGDLAERRDVLGGYLSHCCSLLRGRAGRRRCGCGRLCRRRLGLGGGRRGLVARGGIGGRRFRLGRLGLLARSSISRCFAAAAAFASRWRSWNSLLLLGRARAVAAATAGAAARGVLRTGARAGVAAPRRSRGPR